MRLVVSVGLAALLYSTNLDAITLVDDPGDAYHQRPRVVCLSAVSMRAALGGEVRKMHKAYDGAFYEDGSVQMEFWLSDTGRWAMLAAFDSAHYCIREIGVRWSPRRAGDTEGDNGPL